MSNNPYELKVEGTSVKVLIDLDFTQGTMNVRFEDSSKANGKFSEGFLKFNTLENRILEMFDISAFVESLCKVRKTNPEHNGTQETYPVKVGDYYVVLEKGMKDNTRFNFLVSLKKEDETLGTLGMSYKYKSSRPYSIVHLDVDNHFKRLFAPRDLVK